MFTTLVTGCDYGIGFELARQYAADGWRVHALSLDAASRERIETLDGDVHFHHLEVSDPIGIATLARTLRGEPIDLLLNNAAIRAVSQI